MSTNENRQGTFPSSRESQLRPLRAIAGWSRQRWDGVAIDFRVGSGHLYSISATPVGGHLFKTPARQRRGSLHSMIRVAVLIDGGHLRVRAKIAKFTYNPELINRIGHSCVLKSEQLFRILYYDCAPYSGTVKLPVSANEREFNLSDEWLKQLGAMEYFAIRLGVLKFRGFKPKTLPVENRPPTDEDFEPIFEQKGVDMRIGLDIANFASTKSVDRIILLSADTDCLPAMKHARINGLQVVLACVPGLRPARELRVHSDFLRRLVWPQQENPAEVGL
jgi:uncharacterized LabA/DUF88 family protein